MAEAESELSQVSSVFYALLHSHASDMMEKMATEFSSKLQEYSTELSQDPDLLELTKRLLDSDDNADAEISMMIKKDFFSFKRNGAFLKKEDKKRIAQIDQELSSLGLKFNENLRKEVGEFVLWVDDPKKLSEIPKVSLEQARETAREKGGEKEFAFTFQAPSYVPFMQYCSDSELRKEMLLAYRRRCFQGEFDNQDIVKNLLKLRYERAQLLGYKNHVDYVLEMRMIKDAKEVQSFLSNLLDKAMKKALEDQERINKLHPKGKVEAWDYSYYLEKLRKAELRFDQEELRPYFKLENVIDGVFKVSERLFGLAFKERSDLPRYHEEVKVYEVIEEEASIGLFYCDFHPRPEKQSGAWMTSFRDRGYSFGEVKTPHVSIVCNFTKSTQDTPALLSLDEVLTLFHEFGHALHGLLSKTDYTQLSGTSVPLDFVELPSQLLENWVLEEETLNMFAFHYESGNVLPKDFIDKIKQSNQFFESYATLRQLGFALLDLELHLRDPSSISSLVEIETQVMKKTSLLTYPEEDCFTCSFGHLFGGGYSAGYYSYKWAEVLEADIFSRFKELGIFDQGLAKKYKKVILEKGGTVEPMEMFVSLMGRSPDIEPLISRSGLSE